MGWRMKYAEKIIFNLYFGGGVKVSEINNNENRYDNILQLGYTGVVPLGGFQFGVTL